MSRNIAVTTKQKKQNKQKGVHDVNLIFEFLIMTNTFTNYSYAAGKERDTLP